MITQSFKLDGQHIERVNYQYLVSDSRNLIGFVFTFSPEWDGVAKTAVITTGGTTYNCLIGADGTIAPANMPVLRDGECVVSVFGGDLYTSDAAHITVYDSGLKGGISVVAPPQDVYAQILKVVTDADTRATAAEQTANDTQNKAAQEAAKARSSAAAAEQAKQGAALSVKAAEDTARVFDTNAAAKTAELVSVSNTALTTISMQADRAQAAADRAESAAHININKYSVRFTGANPTGSRENSAVGMVANVAVDGASVRNDFDGVPFFDRPICCCTRFLTGPSAAAPGALPSRVGGW